MSTRTRFRITVENEGRLENIFRASASRAMWIACAAAALVVVMLLGVFIVVVSPVHHILPGYLKDSERDATVEQHLRIDSLREAYNHNEMYLENLLGIMDGRGGADYKKNEESSDSAKSFSTNPIQVDSLLPTSPAELKFAAMMREREKYNISVVAPLAAESMLFFPVSSESVVTQASRHSKKAEIILARGASVAAIADGTVIAVSQSVREGGGASVIIQHQKGFLSRYSRLGPLFISPGDVVQGGQVIAHTSSGNALKGERIFLELWLNGTPLTAADYIGSPSKEQRQPVVDRDVGRGRL